MSRPVLLRTEGATTSHEIEAACAAAMTAGFQGVDVSLPVDAEFPAGLRLAPAILTVSLACETVVAASEMERLASLLRTLGCAGAKGLNITIPPIAIAENDGDRARFARYQEAINFTHDVLHGLQLEAETSGVALAIEAPAVGCLFSPVELREAIDAANSWALGACLDCRRVAALGHSLADWASTLTHRVHAIRCPLGEDGNSLEAVPHDRPLIRAQGAPELQSATREGRFADL